MPDVIPYLIKLDLIIDDNMIELIKTFGKEVTNGEELGLDRRAASPGFPVYVLEQPGDVDIIVVHDSDKSAIRYYGGFEHVDSDSMRYYGSYIVYFAYDERVNKAIKTYRQNQLTNT